MSICIIVLSGTVLYSCTGIPSEILGIGISKKFLEDSYRHKLDSWHNLRNPCKIIATATEKGECGSEEYRVTEVTNSTNLPGFLEDSLSVGIPKESDRNP